MYLNYFKIQLFGFIRIAKQLRELILLQHSAPVQHVHFDKSTNIPYLNHFRLKNKNQINAYVLEF